MKSIKNLRGKYLLAILLVLLFINAVCAARVFKHTQDSMLREKYVDIVQKVDMLAAAVEANPERNWQDHEQNIRASVEFLDRLHQIYAAVYKQDNGEYTLLSDREFETSVYEPFAYSRFVEAIAQDSGGLVVGYTPDKQKYRDLHIYFRWMPLYSKHGERYLVVAGVSKHSITQKTYPTIAF